VQLDLKFPNKQTNKRKELKTNRNAACSFTNGFQSSYWPTEMREPKRTVSED
jgi:hypothetical protein